MSDPLLRAAGAAQLDLFEAGEAIETTRPPDRLTDRLYAAGLPRHIRVVVHANRRVLVSLTVRGALRVHLGYHAAPPEVLLAIVRWARPRTRRAEQLHAQRILTAFPVHQHVPPEAVRVHPPPRPRPGDERIFARLHDFHAALNRRHFGGELGRVRMAWSARMRRRLGEFRLSADGCHEIVIARRHLRRDGWRGVIETLAHEMVHQWQAETGRRLGHGAEFRRMWVRLAEAEFAGWADSGCREDRTPADRAARRRPPDSR